ncbi:MAG TPA: helix-turn-helix transcriptional regulator [Pseudonocardia sp.]|jgi:transcriptional regulator with XRE-family HTH domain|uniref:helix-turn-helix domain-containing protein n=1 Tax=Pseudonocardia sp. TaxID=60912 RepID=UPI002CEE6BCB|nr:helix-turn-helix transcriptional regulator [Pseudonocardia sp.]HTF52225.1 helix-turn-helix transcriptional regulator [Pseudonocardia sp.]
MTLLLREAIGGSLRRARTTRRRTLREVSHQARVSLGYLSEVERGRKEASSELLAAICDALEFPLPDLLAEVAESMRPLPMQPLVPMVPIGTRHTDLRRATVAPQSVSAGTPASPLVSVAA